jgi:hypothetical protein
MFDASNKRRQRDHLERRGVVREGAFMTIQRTFMPEEGTPADGTITPSPASLLPHEIFTRVLARFSPQ